MGLYWKSIIVKATGCDYQIAGKIEELIDLLYPSCTEAQLLVEAPIALRALNRLNDISMDIFNKSYEKLTVDEFCDFHELYQKYPPWDAIRFAA